MADYTDRDEDFESLEATEQTDDYNLSDDDFGNLVIAPADWTIGTLYDQIGKQIDLDPAFQRRNVWSPSAKSSFIESLLLGIPIPQILLSSKPGERNSFLVLDGKQRLLTIKEFLEGRLPSGRVFRLKKLRVLKEIEGACWGDLKEDPSWSQRLLNETQRTAVIRNWGDEPVLYEIFFRLNSASVKLSPMELRMSLHPGMFLKFIVTWSETIGPLHEVISKKVPDPRMNDVELAVRYLAFRDNRFVYEGDLKKFLDEACVSLNQCFVENANCEEDVVSELQNMQNAIQTGMDEFDRRKFCRKYIDGEYENRFNRAIFDIQVGALSNQELREKVALDRGRFESVFKDVSEENDFIRAIETTTKSTEATATRFGRFYSALSEAFGVELGMPKIAKQ